MLGVTFPCSFHAKHVYTGTQERFKIIASKLICTRTIFLLLQRYDDGLNVFHSRELAHILEK